MIFLKHDPAAPSRHGNARAKYSRGLSGFRQTLPHRKNWMPAAARLA